MPPSVQDLRRQWRSLLPELLPELKIVSQASYAEYERGQLVTSADTDHSDPEVRAGELSLDARELFVAGQCHALAFAVFEQKGWPIIWLGDPDNAHFDGGCMEHLAVIHPSDLILDVSGLKTLATHLESHTTAGALTPEQMRNDVPDAFLTADMALARSMVDPVFQYASAQYPQFDFGSDQSALPGLSFRM